ncbi:hypothetical protein R5R73_04860 [Salinicola sp. LHM]|uniref:hypothetical protein n=1 Tax=Salinicola sp. LHM TaxID=3065298 RepID=UPI002ACDF214|nr:hypothetical protein [Salinicola sp. LHM]WQH34020.1 hypothetical protein R5R73_04860 [Salinicola sp. LHM]
MNRFYGWLVAGVAVVMGTLASLVLLMRGQRDAARDELDKAKARTKGVEAARAVERRIDERQRADQAQAREVEREQMAQRRAGVRPELFGDPRLHDSTDYEHHP